MALAFSLVYRMVLLAVDSKLNAASKYSSTQTGLKSDQQSASCDITRVKVFQLFRCHLKLIGDTPKNIFTTRERLNQGGACIKNSTVASITLLPIHYSCTFLYWQEQSWKSPKGQKRARKFHRLRRMYYCGYAH